MSIKVNYQLEKNIAIKEFKNILIESGIKKRPITDEKRLETMCNNSNLIITARVNSKLVGVARSITDFSYCTYLSDLAVSEGFKHIGIGKELVRLTKDAAPDALLVLLAAPEAITYYPKLGMRQYEYCYVLKK
jgi:hypothetical protein